MDDDVHMDAPSISTLPEEKTPPPRRRKAESSKKKQPKLPTPVALSLSWRKSGQGSEIEQAEGEDEEDQLIDDEDDAMIPAATPSAKTSEAAPKKKASAKRKPRKEPGPEDESKKRPKTSAKPRKIQAPGLEATPSESLSIDDGTDAGTGANTPSISVVESEPQDPSSVPKPAKKKGNTPRKSAPKAAKQKPSGLKMVIPALSSIAVDDNISVMSEGGTAASSPVTGIFEKSQPGSPEHEQPAPSSPTTAAAPLPEETNLENIPLPVYPLPSKPFPVQAPPKMPTGFAPPLPLDKSGKKVRHWRTAQREIRGIAGGRWFVRSWVGDKDSEYATHVIAKEGEKSNGLPSSLKQSAGTSVSAPPTGRVGKKAKGASSLAASAAPSRDTSVVPPESGTNANTGTSATSVIPIATSTVRAPTKMRIQQLPEDTDPQSDTAMDTDLVPPPDPDSVLVPSSEPSALASSL